MTKFSKDIFSIFDVSILIGTKVKQVFAGAGWFTGNIFAINLSSENGLSYSVLFQ